MEGGPGARTRGALLGPVFLGQLTETNNLEKVLEESPKKKDDAAGKTS